MSRHAANRGLGWHLTDAMRRDRRLSVLAASVAALLTVAALVLPASALNWPAGSPNEGQLAAAAAQEQVAETPAATTEATVDAAPDANADAPDAEAPEAVDSSATAAGASTTDETPSSDDPTSAAGATPQAPAAPQVVAANAPAKGAPLTNESSDKINKTNNTFVKAGEKLVYDWAYTDYVSTVYDNPQTIYQSFFLMEGAAPNYATDTPVFCVNDALAQPAVVTDVTETDWFYKQWENSANLRGYINANVGFGYYAYAEAAVAGWRYTRVIRTRSGQAQPRWHMVGGKPSLSASGQDTTGTSDILGQALKFVLYNGSRHNTGKVYGGRYTFMDNPNADYNDQARADLRFQVVTQRVVKLYANSIALDSDDSLFYLNTPEMRACAADFQTATDAYIQWYYGDRSQPLELPEGFKVPPEEVQLNWLITDNSAKVGLASVAMQDFVYITVPDTPTPTPTPTNLDVLKAGKDKVATGAAAAEAPLAGAQLSLRKDTADGEVVASWTTDATGRHTLENLAPGTYVLVEDQAPEDWALAAPITFLVDEQGQVLVNGKALADKSITMTDYKCHDVRLVKTGVNGQLTVDAHLAGAHMAVIETDAEGNRSGRALDFWTTEEPITGKLPDGYYVLVEEEAPAGYDMAPEIRFQVTAEGQVMVLDDGQWTNTGDATLVMKDQVSKTTAVSVKKEWGEGYDKSHSTDYVKVHLTLDGQDVEGSQVTLNASNGWAHTWTGLPEGTYQVVEDEAYAAYYPNATWVPKYEMETGAAPTAPAWVDAMANGGLQDGKEYVISAKNYQASMVAGSTYVSTRTFDPAATGEVAGDQLWKAENRNGSWFFYNETTGKYLYMMDALALGTSRNAAGFSVDANGTVRVASNGGYANQSRPFLYPSTNGKFYTATSAGYSTPYAFYEKGSASSQGTSGITWTITNDMGGSLYLNLVKETHWDNNQRLAGATFELYGPSDTPDDPSWKDRYVGAQTTGDTGEVTWEGLKAGYYWVVETKAPSGYDPITSPIKVHVEGDGKLDGYTDGLPDVQLVNR